MIIVADGKYFQFYMTYNMMMYDLVRIDFDMYGVWMRIIEDDFLLRESHTWK